MISRCIAGVFAFAFLVSSAVAAQDLTLDQILKKNEDAIGGADAISRVQTLRTTSRMVMSDGQTEMVATVSSKRPNFVRIETAVMGSNIVWAFDGTTAWMINPLAGGSEPQKMDEATIARSPMPGWKVPSAPSSASKLPATP
jgi:outer membrane lipoprotein-sorting protein